MQVELEELNLNLNDLEIGSFDELLLNLESLDDYEPDNSTLGYLNIGHSMTETGASLPVVCLPCCSCCGVSL